ncbi:MAG TPA: hypothetical protein VNI83_05140 [Vicinamibacterales bacterium]|nr:hypothetical protein [Vicinamibacterales bacterium]
MVMLAVISAIGAAALFVALAVFVVLILRGLEAAGGHPTGDLARIRLGVRAIEVHTSHLGPLVTRLDGTLRAIRDGLRRLEADLDATLAAVARQRGR